MRGSKEISTPARAGNDVGQRRVCIFISAPQHGAESRARGRAFSVCRCLSVAPATFLLPFHASWESREQTASAEINKGSNCKGRIPRRVAANRIYYFASAR